MASGAVHSVLSTRNNCQFSAMRNEVMINPAYEGHLDELKVDTKTSNKVPVYTPKEVKDTGSENGYLNIFFNVCGILLALATLPLGLYQEINVQTHDTMNSIKLELYGIQGPSVKLGMPTTMYFWTLSKSTKSDSYIMSF